MHSSIKKVKRSNCRHRYGYLRLLFCQQNEVSLAPSFFRVRRCVWVHICECDATHLRSRGRSMHMCVSVCAHNWRMWAQSRIRNIKGIHRYYRTMLARVFRVSICTRLAQTHGARSAGKMQVLSAPRAMRTRRVVALAAAPHHPLHSCGESVITYAFRAVRRARVVEYIGGRQRRQRTELVRIFFRGCANT